MTYIFENEKFMSMKHYLDGFVMWKKIENGKIEVRQVISNPFIRRGLLSQSK